MMARRYILIIAVVVASSLICGPLAAQDWSGSGRAKGTVKDADGNPIEGAQVFYRLVYDREMGPPPFTTNKKGKFSFLGLKGGTWVVRVEAEGYHPWMTPRPVDVFSTGVSPSVDAVLEAIPKEELIARARGAANDNMKAGDALLDEGNYAGARSEYERALAVLEEDDFPIVYGALANTYMGEGNVAGAAEMADKALAVDPEFVPAMKIKCAIVASQGNLEEAEALLAKIPNDEVMHPNTLMNIGLAHFNKGEMEEAKVFLDRTIRDHPDVGQTYYFRGLTYLNLNEAPEAKADFEHFLELEPDSPQAAEAKEYLSYLTSQGASQ